MISDLAGVQAQHAVLSSGGDASGIGGSVSYSIGQVAYAQADGESGRINQGVQQPYEMIMISTAEPDLQMAVSLFPNPSTATLMLKLDDYYPLTGKDNFSFGLFDLYGKTLLHEKINTALTPISIGHLTEAIYILKVFRDHTEIRTFKMVKIN